MFVWGIEPMNRALLIRRYGNGTLAYNNTEYFYEWLSNLYLPLPTSRALFNRVTVCCEWDLNPQLLD